ncbi:hypothetical protein F4780DRAFT_719622 [Xylariomycetidae sp. FL0641]|nr:hypothetical protein F4780DRAFT_719622 [Xylariomycetidae sp. FL0641]
MSAPATAAMAHAPEPEPAMPQPVLDGDNHSRADVHAAPTTDTDPDADTEVDCTVVAAAQHDDADRHDSHDLGIEVASAPPTKDAPPLDSLKPTGLHSPPDSNNAMKLDGSDSELSDVEDPTLDIPEPASAQSQPDVEQEAPDEDIGEVNPDHWSGTVPVFKPTMFQFKDFKKFMEKIDCYGMKSGIVKVIPPQEWKDKLPALDDMVKQIRVKEPIKQDIMGSTGTYRQVNILHQRSYNLPQWRTLCDQSEHQPPARRGERRAQAPARPKVTSSASSATAKKRVSGRTTRSRAKRGAAKDSAAEQEERPMTPISPKPADQVVDSVEQDPGADVDEDEDNTPPAVGRMGGSRQARPKTQSTSARRKFARREGSARIDEEAFKNWDYRMDISDYTPERCEELEKIYWKTLTYAPPLYGADLPGTLFDDSTESWNLNKLPNLLDVLGTKVPGVNTAYLYLGMWKATFAWHLEDVDLYSINYLHFGAPKQWYSISQGDARRFEAAMKSIWPTDAKACDQFLRHKAFLISPNHLLNNFNIKVNKCVSYPGEFVVTYPYGYHSGYNLGYNCAEAVNFALDSWLPMGKIAKRCECAQAQDSVWVDVYEIERKLRGEETEYEETDEEDEEEEDDEEDGETSIMTPRSSSAVKFKQPTRKRKRAATDKGEKKAKKVRLRVKAQVEPPCCLCPHDIPSQELLPTDDERKAHRVCALYGAETWIETVEGKEVVANAANISKARLDLKCLFCRSKRGACFQCSQKKCARSYHATCAAAAGVLVEEEEVPIFGEDGTEYKEQAFAFSCRFHRTKRDKKMDGDALDACEKTRQAAAALKKGEICQLQYFKGDIFAGVVVENRSDEQTLLLDILPNGDRVEVEWKWLLLPDPADLHLQKASPNAIPMPTSRKAKELINATKRQIEELPRADDPFVDGFTWAEFHHHDLVANKAQAKVDLSKENQLWLYLGRNSTEARPQYTEDPKGSKHNPKSNFLETVPRPPPLPAAQPRKSYGSASSVPAPAMGPARPEKPYQYKPKKPVPPSYMPSPFTAQQFAPKPTPYTTQQFTPKPYAHPPQPSLPRLPPYSMVQQQPGSPSPFHTFHQTQPTPQPTPQPQPAQWARPVQPAPPKPSPYHTFQALPAPKPPSAQSTPQPVPLMPRTNGHSVQPAFGNASPGLSQQHMPKPALPRPTPPPTGHSRNRSSVGSQGSLNHFGADPRFRRTPPASYGRGRFDSNSGSPFSHGIMQPPGLGPSPSPKNGQTFQAQARARSSSAASNGSLHAPMTSSAIRPSSSANVQALASNLQSVVLPRVDKEARPSIIQKYAFFQVHHNRDSTKYRTPYAHWGGFTNGYEGNLRAHLMRSPEALFAMRRSSSNCNGSSSMSPSLSAVPRQSFGHAPSTPVAFDPASHNSRTVAAQTCGKPQEARIASPVKPAPTIGRVGTQPAAGQRVPSEGSSWNLESEPGTTLHPAIKAHYVAMLKERNSKLEDRALPEHARSILPAPSPGPANSSAQTTAGRQSKPATPFSSTPPNPPPARNMPTTPVSTTPVPPPSLPAKSAPNTPGSTGVSATKASTIPARQSYIPPPRPWEMVRKTQQHTTHTQPTPSFAPSSTTQARPSPAHTLPGVSGLAALGQGSYVNNMNGPASSRHLPNPASQPSHFQPAALRAVPGPKQQSSAEYQSHPGDVQRSQPKVGAQQLSSGTIHQQQRNAGTLRHPERSAVPSSLVKSHTTASHLATAGDLPEVSDGSMELVESIIRNAQRASGIFG